MVALAPGPTGANTAANVGLPVAGGGRGRVAGRVGPDAGRNRALGKTGPRRDRAAHGGPRGGQRGATTAGSRGCRSLGRGRHLLPNQGS